MLILDAYIWQINAHSQLLEQENSNTQETTDLSALATIFEPHTNENGCKDFKLSGEHYVWAIAKFAFFVEPIEWYQLFIPNGKVTCRIEDGTRKTRGSILYLWHLHQQTIIDEFRMRNREGTDAELNDYLVENRVQRKNSNWLTNARPRLTLPSKSSKYPLPALTANLLLSFYRKYTLCIVRLGNN